MKEDPRLFATLEASRETWGLGPLPPAQGALQIFGWSRRLAMATDDAPAPFATILASALTHIGPLAFPTSELILETGVRRNRAAFAVWAPRRRQTFFRARSVLCLTRDTALAANIFNDGAFPWELQGQFGLLCVEGASIERLVAFGDALDDLIEPCWSGMLTTLNMAGVVAILRPTVDGVAAGLLAVDEALNHRILVAVANAASQSEVVFEVLDEANFATALAT